MCCKQADIPLEKFNNVLAVTVLIWSRRENRFRKVDLVVDTGASVTTMSKDVLSLLGYDAPKADTTTTTASGVERVSGLALDKMSIGGIEIPNVAVYAHQFPGEIYFAGLLGLNVLRLFDVELLFGRSLMRLTPAT